MRPPCAAPRAPPRLPVAAKRPPTSERAPRHLRPSSRPRPRAPAAAPPAACSHDIPGNDIPSGGQPYTKVCVPAGGYKGKYGYDAFKLLCDENPKCVAFTAPARPDGCAYLKSKGRRDVIKANKDFVAVTSAEPPQKACKFAALGESCSSDPWADQPVCECGRGPRWPPRL